MIRRTFSRTLCEKIELITRWTNEDFVMDGFDWKSLGNVFHRCDLQIKEKGTKKALLLLLRTGGSERKGQEIGGEERSRKIT